MQGEHGDGVGAVVAAVEKFFAIAFEGDLLGEHATAHVQHDIDKVIWLDNSGGEDDAVEAAFFFNFSKPASERAAGMRKVPLRDFM